MSVQDRIAAWEARTTPPRIAASLQTVLDEAWRRRRIHRGRGAARSFEDRAEHVNVYDIYNRITDNDRFEPGAMAPFVARLAAFDTALEVQCNIARDPAGQPMPRARQRDEDLLGHILRTRYGAVRARSGFALLSPRRVQGLARVLRAGAGGPLAAELGETFFHFRNALSDSRHRIYLNVKEMHRAEVLGWCLANIRTLPGCANLKGSGPSTLNRADTVVIYLDDRAALRRATSRIAAYQERAHVRAMFNAAVPQMTRPLDGLVGASTGDEPYVGLELDEDDYLAPTRDGSSFGTYRAQLIELALDWTLDGRGDKTAFEDRVRRYFRLAGIDPATPHVHGGGQTLIRVARRIEWLHANGRDVPANLLIGG